MGPRPEAWRLADHELEPRVVAPSDRDDPHRWRLGYGWPMDTAVQRTGFACNAWGHNRAGWPVQ